MHIFVNVNVYLTYSNALEMGDVIIRASCIRLHWFKNYIQYDASVRDIRSSENRSPEVLAVMKNSSSQQHASFFSK